MEIIRPQANSGVNPVQQFSAVNAFKSSSKPVSEKVEQGSANTGDGVNSSTNKNILDRVDVNDIRECAKTVGEYNITDEDIKYGLLYGRSVIAEWLC